MLGRPAPSSFEPHKKNGAQRWRFRPIAELLLRDLKDVASEKAVPEQMRRARIQWALEMAGF